MTGPVHEGTQWRTPWQRLAEDDRTRMLEELAGQIRGHLPDGTQLHRLQLRCYPRHALLRFTVPSQDGPREAYAFYAPGQLYPLDWKLPSLRAFDEVALELNSETQAEDYLRVTTWGFVREHGRSFIIEDADQLRLDKNVELDVATRERLTELRPLHRVPRHAGDPNDRFRFRCALLYGHDLKAFDFTVEPLSCEGLEADDDFEPIELPGLEDRVQSDRFFVLVRETSLTASRFLRQLRRGPVHQARVIEPVSLRNEAFEEPVILSQVTFEHGADFAGARFESGLTLESCVCEGQLSLRDTSIAGSLDAARLTFHRDGSRREDGSLEKETRFGRDLVDLDGSGMKVEGSVYLEGLRTLNMVDLGRISVAGDVRIGGSRIGRPRDPSAEPSRETALRLDNGSVGGDLDLVYCRQARYRLGPETGDAQMDEVIPGFSTPSTVVRGRLAARGMDVSGEVELGGLRCEGSLDLSGLTSGANLSADADGPHRRLIVLGSFGLENATIEGSVRLHGAHVGGSLRLSSCRIRGSVFGRTYAAAWGRVHPLHVGGDLVLSGTHVDDVDLQGARVGGITMITGELGRLRLMPGVETTPTPGGPRATTGPDGFSRSRCGRAPSDSWT